MKTWIAAIALFAALTAAAQAETVAGTVVDREDRPVANADVTVTFASSAAPLHVKTDAAGRFTVETTEPPSAVTLRRNGYAPFTMAVAAVAPSAVANLHIRLERQLFVLKEFRPRSLCGAFQPSQPWDRYVIVPGGPCGASKR